MGITYLQDSVGAVECRYMELALILVIAFSTSFFTAMVTTVFYSTQSLKTQQEWDSLRKDLENTDKKQKLLEKHLGLSYKIGDLSYWCSGRKIPMEYRNSNGGFCDRQEKLVNHLKLEYVSESTNPAHYRKCK